MEKETGMFHVFEWNIENFSCWNRELRDTIASPPSTFPVLVENNPSTYKDVSFTIELCLGVKENEEHIVAILYKGSVFALSGELSFIGSDGSILRTQPVVSNHEENVPVLLPGPKFRDVVAQIRRNDTLHGDHLTVRCRIRSFYKTITDYKKTTIDVLSASFKISLGTLMRSSSMGTDISRLNYSGANGRREMVLSCSTDQIDHSKVALKLQSFSVSKKVLVFTRLALVNRDNEVVRTKENEHFFRDCKAWVFSNSLTRKDVSIDGISFIFYFKIIPSIGLKDSIQVRSLHEIMHVPKVLFRDSVARVPEERRSRSQTAVSSNNFTDNSVCILTKELMCLYQDQDFSDFQLKCGDVSIPVHKNILSARSPVFKTMFSTDMRESVSGCMDIVDLDPSTLSQFLAFLYSGTVEELQGESVIKLYYAADKYQVPSLKRECADVLCANVSISNVCDILSLANSHQDDQLITSAHDFILKNFNEVLSSVEWKSFMRNEPLLAVETVTHFAEKNYVGKKDTQ